MATDRRGLFILIAVVGAALLSLFACGEIPSPGQGPAPPATGTAVSAQRPATASTSLSIPPEVGGLSIDRASGVAGVLSIAVDPQDPTIVYAGAANGLFRSTDGGDSWQLLSEELRYPHTLLVDPHDPHILYAGCVGDYTVEPGIYRSTDGGASWQLEENGLAQVPVTSLASDPTTPGTLYVGSRQGQFYQSVDGGETATLATQQPLGGPIAGAIRWLLVDPGTGALYARTAQARTFRSDDGGSTWTRLRGDVGPLALNEATGALYSGGVRLQRSTDGGAHWAFIDAGLPYDTRHGTYGIEWIAVNPDPAIVYVQTRAYTLFRSVDGGATWTPLEIPPYARFIARGLRTGPNPTIYGSVSGTLGWYVDNPAQDF